MSKELIWNIKNLSWGNNYSRSNLSFILKQGGSVVCPCTLFLGPDHPDCFQRKPLHEWNNDNNDKWRQDKRCSQLTKQMLTKTKNKYASFTITMQNFYQKIQTKVYIESEKVSSKSLNNTRKSDPTVFNTTS